MADRDGGSGRRRKAIATTSAPGSSGTRWRCWTSARRTWRTSAQIGRLVEFEDDPGVVETALALSGSAAQSKIQTYPGDADYFERVNILRPTREEACRILARIMREKALEHAARARPTSSSRSSSAPIRSTVMREGKTCKAGSPRCLDARRDRGGADRRRHSRTGRRVSVRWDGRGPRPGLVQAGLGDGRPDPRPAGQRQQHAGRDLGSAGRDDHAAGRLPGPYFQEVYLDAASVPIFAKLAQARLRRRPGRLCGAARARGGEVPDRDPQITARWPSACTTSSA